MTGTVEVVAKGEFAKLLKVTPARVSQYISEGKLTGDALVGTGVRAKINVPVARAQLRDGLDISQRMGNGLDTRLDDAPVKTGPAHKPSIEDSIRQEKLRQMQAQSRKLAEEEAVRAGRYIETTEARQQMTRIAGQMLKLFEGGLADMASKLASRFELPQRDVLHELRQGFRDVRKSAAGSLEQEAASTDEHVTVTDDREEDNNGDGNHAGEPGEGGAAGDAGGDDAAAAG